MPHADEVKAARERLDVHSRNADAQRALVGAKGSIAWGNDTPRVEDVRAVLSHIDALEARVAVLAAALKQVRAHGDACDGRHCQEMATLAAVVLDDPEGRTK